MSKGSNNTSANASGRRHANADGRRHAKATTPGRPPCYAAIDLGTNNCRMLVARPDGDANAAGLRVVDGFSRIVRLGEGLAASGRLSEEAIERTIQVLKICAGKNPRSRRYCHPRRRHRSLPPGRQRR